MKNFKIYLIVILMSSLSLTAQNNDTKNADKHFAKFEFVEAAKAYAKLVEKGKADEYVLYTTSRKPIFNIYNTVEAERWYAKALETSQTPETLYNYAQMLKANGKYEQSNTWMSKFCRYETRRYSRNSI